MSSQSSSSSSALSQALGYVITGGSALVKLPQIVAILKSQSVDGISPAMFELEVCTQTISILYHLKKGFPFSTYGENVSQGLPNLGILALIHRYSKGPDSRTDSAFLSRAALFAAATAILYHSYERHPKVLETLQGASVGLYVASRIPQLLQNIRTQNTGQLSSVAFAANLCGSLARLYTTVKQLQGDRVMLFNFAVSIFLNAVMIGQIWAYGAKPQRK